MEPAWNPRRLPLRDAIQRPGANVCSRPIEVPAAARARWLAEVAESLEQAEILLNRLKHDGYPPANLVDLSMSIEAAKREVGSLRMNRPPRIDDPKWTKLPPWEPGEPSSL